MQVILNIGLAVDATSSIAAHVAKEILKANGFFIGKAAEFVSDTEPTLVVEAFTHGAPGPAVFQTAVDLQQDCIACYLPSHNVGRLIGPKAAEWGKFNPTFFITIDGRRLS